MLRVNAAHIFHWLSHFPLTQLPATWSSTVIWARRQSCFDWTEFGWVHVECYRFYKPNGHIALWSHSLDTQTLFCMCCRQQCGEHAAVAQWRPAFSGSFTWLRSEGPSGDSRWQQLAPTMLAIWERWYKWRRRFEWPLLAAAVSLNSSSAICLDDTHFYLA